MAEQTINAFDFPIDCRFPDCQHSTIKADMEAHEQVCEYSLKECWLCHERVAFDVHDEHERSCAHDELIRLQETVDNRQYQLDQASQAFHAMRRRALRALMGEHVPRFRETTIFLDGRVRRIRSMRQSCLNDHSDAYQPHHN